MGCGRGPGCWSRKPRAFGLPAICNRDGQASLGGRCDESAPFLGALGFFPVRRSPQALPANRGHTGLGGLTHLGRDLGYAPSATQAVPALPQVGPRTGKRMRRPARFFPGRGHADPVTARAPWGSSRGQPPPLDSSPRGAVGARERGRPSPGHDPVNTLRGGAEWWPPFPSSGRWMEEDNPRFPGPRIANTRSPGPGGNPPSVSWWRT
eukprot:10421547-Heterocapsa_arctica.AAC.2